MDAQIFKYLEEKSEVRSKNFVKTARSRRRCANTNANGGEAPTQCLCMCSSVRACANAYTSHRELFVRRSEFLEAPAFSQLQLHVNSFVTIFI